LTKITAKVTL